MPMIATDGWAWVLDTSTGWTLIARPHSPKVPMLDAAND
jgi:hypothetical protein